MKKLIYVILGVGLTACFVTNPPVKMSAQSEMSSINHGNKDEVIREVIKFNIDTLSRQKLMRCRKIMKKELKDLKDEIAKQ